MADARLLFLVLLFPVLSGCASPKAPQDAVPAAVGIPEIHILPGGSVPSASGPFYSIADLNLTAPARVRFVNDDNAYHRIMGQVGSAAAPMWAYQALGPAAHTHGGPSIVVDAELEPGATLEVDVPLDGEIGIHCHPHPWMLGHWSVSPNGTHDYPVSIGSLRMTGEATATLEAGGHKSHNLGLGPNVRQVRANLTWDDGADDLAIGEPANAPDSLRLAIIGPQGNVVASANATSRTGFIEAIFATPSEAWPSSVTASRRSEAEAMLRGQRPDESSWSGSWRIEVDLVAAPGPVPDDAGLLNPLPSTDGKQAWTLAVETLQQWVVIGSGEEVMHGNWDLAANG